MDGVQGPSPILGNPAVRERKGGSQRDAEAFRRAMQQQGDDGAGPRDPDRPVRRPLQPQRGIDRNNDGQAHHVDVVA